MIDQRSFEWHDLRKGKFTASQIYRLMGLKGIGKTGESYVMEKVAEELGAEMPLVSTFAMDRGTEMEPYAKLHYMKAFDCKISPCSFIIAPWCDQAGASPDGIIKKSGSQKLIEIKCPYNPVNHIQNLMIKTMDELKNQRSEYYWQMQMQMAVMEIPVCDFVSYYPDINEDFRMIAITIEANWKDILLLKQRIYDAVEMKKKILERVKL